MSISRRLRSFPIAILLAAFVCAIVLALPPYYPNALKYPDVAFGVLFAAWIFSIPVVALGGLLFGMPTSFALETLGVNGYGKWAAAGAVAGGLYSLLVTFLFTGAPSRVIDALVMAWLGFLPGLVTGLFWWGAVARHERLADGSA